MSISEQISKYDVYVFYAGNRDVSGHFTHKKCNSTGTAFSKTATGDAESFDAQRDGALGCKETLPSGTLGIKVQKQYC